MSIQRKFREILGIHQSQTAFVELRPELATAVSEIAAQNGRTISHALCDRYGMVLHRGEQTYLHGRFRQHQILETVQKLGFG